MCNETVWVWLQTKGTVLKVISNPGRGTIEVLNENGETLIRKTNLTRRQVELVEKIFLKTVAKKLNGRNEIPVRKPKDSYDPMIA
jgi:hypothetical protein